MALEPFASQTDAIESPPGPILVLAGPGAGKTFCLIRRIEYLIQSLGFAPERICAVTFTNKAAEEVTVRLHRRLGARADLITRGTLHALCLGLLRERAEAAGLKPGFGVADDQYQELLLRRLRVYPAKRRTGLLTLFGRRRLQGYELSEGDEAIFYNYISLLREKNLVDFDDIIALTDDLLTRHPEVASQVGAHWDYVLVDEFQDLDAAQYSVIKRLVQTHRNIFAVGDDEQSIFSWRGSDPRLLWRFQNEFEIEEPVLLDRNWRCSRQIFEVARRLLRENPELFRKDIEAERDSPFDVEAHAFPDEVAEADWILRDLLADRERHGQSWGAYALLYRRHAVGDDLEDRFIAAGVPCRLVRGRSLLDDPVIAYVVASLRVIVAPDDPVAVEAFAQRLLPQNLLAEVGTFGSAPGPDLLAALRAYARRHPPEHPDTKKAWRFIYHVENLRALAESHDSLAGIVEELLSQRVRPYENRLEEHYDELVDPEGFPGARELADELRRSVSEGRPIYVAPAGGRGIALRGMFASIRFPAPVPYLTREADPGPRDPVLDPASGERPLATTLFKALQLIHSHDFGDLLRDFVTFDLETTDLDPAACEIIELGAARVRDGQVVDTFRSLVYCDRPIAAEAREKHGYAVTDLRGAPTLEEIWPRFRRFVGDDVLVAHNGLRFDVPVLRRSAGRFTGFDDLVFFDTLPLARSLFRESARLGDLAARFGVATGREHHALDDALTLARVFVGLNRQKRVRARKAALVNLLDYLGLGLALEPRRRRTDEDKLLFELAVPYALGRYSDCLEFYTGEQARSGVEAPELDEVIKRLGGRRLMERIRAQRSPAERYPAAVARLGMLTAAARADTLEAAVGRLLELVALSSSEGVEADPHRVNLITLHSTKGLEFSRVYVVGVEDYQIPGYFAATDNVREEIEEARRLLYVGMTRAKDRLVLTRTDRRRGRDSGGSLFLDEIELTPTRV